MSSSIAKLVLDLSLPVSGASLLAHLLRLLCALAGAAAIYAALFLYEDQQGLLRDKLAEFWVKIDDLRPTTKSREAAFLRALSTTLRSRLEQVIGSGIISWRAVIFSGTCSVASGALMLSGLAPPAGLTVKALATSPVYQIVVAIGLSFLSLAILQVIFPKSKLPVACSALLVPCPPIVLFALHSRELVVLIGGLCLGVLFDLAFLLFYHWTLKKVARATSAMVMVPLLLLNIALGVAVTVPSLYVYRWEIYRDETVVSVAVIRSAMESQECKRELTGRKFASAADLYVAETNCMLGIMDRSKPPSWPGVFLYACSTNWIDGILVLVLVASVALLLLQRPLWPLLQLPIYAMQRFNVVGNTKFLLCVGLALIVVAFPTGPIHSAIQWIKELAH